MWQAIWGIIDALLISGLSSLSIGLFLFSFAMAGSELFAKPVVLMAGIMSLLGLAGSIFGLFDPNSFIIALAVFGQLLAMLFIGGNLIRIAAPSAGAKRRLQATRPI
jgi:hypothetical protein